MMFDITTPHVVGFLWAAVPAAFAISVLADDRRRLRRRLKSIFTATLARHEHRCVREVTGQDWLDLYDVIQPHEEA